jgi:hypothetical protein
MQATLLWSLWQALLQPFRPAFTAQGFPRFVQWVPAWSSTSKNTPSLSPSSAWARRRTGSTWRISPRSVTGTSRSSNGPWRDCSRTPRDASGMATASVPSTTARSTAESKKVWGSCTFREYSARCPNRAQTVRAHNWVVLGALLHNEDQPAWFLPQTGKLYFRQSQLPTEPDVEEFCTKNELAVQLLHEQAETLPGKHLAAFDGAFATASVVRPLVCPEDGLPRIDFVTRLRKDARLHALPVPLRAGLKRRGVKAKWGKRLPPPRRGGQWSAGWQEGVAFVYGRRRKVRWKEVLCQWHVLGHDVVIKAVVAEVEGFRKRFCLVCSAVALTGLQIVVLFGARWRQEDGFRDLKQRLGWEECRAWTKKPVLRTSWAQLVALSLLR